ncbi:hypothetical protein SGFS_103330 [Streptomyces graminofaciens]|uniref:Gas vesicle protein n=1 Tax=Streptomyces graminofaciens TaxID=68212 RepID=A0ABM7FS68_9ACTN|nr:GvpL/GvpF family gas vesicle protein [Streptomyces graminofaciens]BBC39039.1 hypothetical protein SGFS_103330 [Streptomyces graminofaciens]
MTGQLRYVYAVCPPLGAASALPSDLAGVAGGAPTPLTHHGLTAVVGTVPEGDFAEEPLRRRLEDLDWLTATARAHQQVVDALMTVTTPLPLRLATVFRDDNGVRVMLEERASHFRGALERLEGRVEWGVKVYVEPEAEPTDSGDAVTRPASGRDYLRRRRQRATAHEDAWQRVEHFAGRLHTTLSAHAEAARLHPPQNAALSGAAGRNVLNAAYLVPRTRSEEFTAIADGAKHGEPGTRVQVTGPWAAYSFLDSDSGSDSGSGSGSDGDGDGDGTGPDGEERKP